MHAKRGVNVWVVERAIMGVRKAVEEGRTITEPLRESGVFPNMVTQMIAVGEQTGAMDAMLQKIADFYEAEVDDAIKNMLTLLEPLIIEMTPITPTAASSTDKVTTKRVGVSRFTGCLRRPSPRPSTIRPRARSLRRRSPLQAGAETDPGAVRAG